MNKILINSIVNRTNKFNSNMELILENLIKNSDFIRLINAQHSEQTVEGSFLCDDYEAAHMIRNYAEQEGFKNIAEIKLQTIARHMRRILIKYGLYRRQIIQTDCNQ